MNNVMTDERRNAGAFRVNPKINFDDMSKEEKLAHKWFEDPDTQAMIGQLKIGDLYTMAIMGFVAGILRAKELYKADL